MNAVNCRRRKPLTGLFRVLAQQRLHFRPVEIAEPQRRSTDVEPSAARTHVTAIVRHLTHPTEHDAVREPVRPFVVAGTQVAEYRQQHVARQGIDLVNQQHQWTRVDFRPAPQSIPECRAWAAGRQHVAHNARQRVVSEHRPPSFGNRIENPRNRLRDVPCHAWAASIVTYKQR